MYEIPTIPAWEPLISKTSLILEYSDPAIKVFEDKDRLKISSNYPTGHNACLYISLDELTQIYSIMPKKVKTTAIHVQDGSETRRKLLIAFLTADERFGCCVMKIGGYSYLLKKEHPLYNKCQMYARKN